MSMINLLIKDYTDGQGMVLEANQSLNPTLFPMCYSREFA